MNWLEIITSIRFGLGRPGKFSSISLISLIARAIGITIDIINIVTSMLKIIFIFFTLAFLCQSFLFELRERERERESNESMTI
jgi:hypothetical protein